MICPNKLCKSEIPDDSCYCDQCGGKLFKCEKCGTISSAKFCGKCGTPMIFIGDLEHDKTEELKVPKEEIVKTEPKEEVSGKTKIVDIPEGGTVIIKSDEKHYLELFHKDGWSIKPEDGSILGRAAGDFTDKLGKFPVISSKHAVITSKNDEWFVTDSHSTNKSYLNEKKLEPGVPEKLNDNDVLMLADIPFIVRIQ